MKFPALLVVAACLVPSTVLAGLTDFKYHKQYKTPVNYNYAHIDGVLGVYTPPQSTDDLSLAGLKIGAQRFLYPYLGFGFDYTNQTLSEDYFESNVSAFNASVLSRVPLHKSVDLGLYGRFGYANLDVSMASSGSLESSVVYGVGASINIGIYDESELTLSLGYADGFVDDGIEWRAGFDYYVGKEYGVGFYVEETYQTGFPFLQAGVNVRYSY